MKDVLVHGKSLEEIAGIEGVDVKVVRLRLHFLCKKLIEHNEELEEYTDWMNNRRRYSGKTNKAPTKEKEA